LRDLREEILSPTIIMRQVKQEYWSAVSWFCSSRGSRARRKNPTTSYGRVLGSFLSSHSPVPKPLKELGVFYVKLSFPLEWICSNGNDSGLLSAKFCFPMEREALGDAGTGGQRVRYSR
jgi:hypothetical protein